MKIITIKFYACAAALPTSLTIEQDYIGHHTLVSLPVPASGAGELTPISVSVDGVRHWLLQQADGRLAIKPPLRQQGERVEIQCIDPCLAPYKPSEGVKPIQSPTPSPSAHYGLQRPV